MQITYEDLRARVSRAIEKRGADFVYPLAPRIEPDNEESCFYREPGTDAPSCIFGVVAQGLGVLDKLGEGEAVHTAFKNAGVQMDERTAKFAKAIQQMQDGGVPYGELLGRWDRGEFPIVEWSAP